jgi:hypothetical protein
MSNLKWYVGQHGENYPYCFDTREEALAHGKFDFFDTGFHLTHAAQDPIRLSEHFVLDDWIFDVDSNALSELGDPEGDGLLIDVDFEGLEEAVRKAIDDWQTAKNVVILPYMFTTIKSSEFIPPEPANDEE